MASTVSFNYAVTGLSTLKGNFIYSTGAIVKASDGSLVTNNSTNRPNASVVGTDVAVPGTYLFTMPTGAPPGPYTLKIWLAPTWANGEQPIGATETNGLTWDGANFTGGTVAGSASTGANQITVGPARSILQDAARNAGVSGTFNDDPYSAAQGDRAIQACLQHFQEQTKFVKQTNTATVAISTNTVDLSGVTGFSTDRILSAWMKPVDNTKTPSSSIIRIVDYEEILQYRRCNTSHSGTPCLLGFVSMNGSDGELDNDVTFAWTIYARWWTTLTSWTAGDSGATSTLINFPADIVTKVLQTYGVICLQRNQPEQIKQGVLNTLQADYDKYIEQKRGAGTLAKSIQRDSVRSVRYNRRW